MRHVSKVFVDTCRFCDCKLVNIIKIDKYISFCVISLYVHISFSNSVKAFFYIRS